MDWEHWTPQERATLCFIRRGEQVLLIRKKRGLGKGKINGPGGKIEPGETALEAAIRETIEELGVVPLAPVEMGDLSFQFADGYSLFCTLYVAEGCEGEPVETDEATPLWTPVDAIPYNEMWADDALWFPKVLAGQRIRGFFEFDGERMVSSLVEDM